jgi:class 3 adenylate cyclase
LADLAQFEFARRESDRLEEFRTVAIEGLAGAQVALGEHGHAIDLLASVVAGDPLRERPRGLLMLALYRAGRHADALAQYRQAVEALGEIGLRPSPELRAVEQQILTHDPALALSEPGSRPASGEGLERRSADVHGRSRLLGSGEVPAGDGPGGLAGGALPTGVVTLLFSDIEGSTALLDALGEGYEEVLFAHRRLLREVWGEHGGREISAEGDAFFVVFVEPETAVRAAAAAQRVLAVQSWPGGVPVRVRIGVHSGVPRVRDGDYWGIDVHYAARLCGAANGGQVLVSSATAGLVKEAELEDLGEHALRDFPVPRRIFHLVLDRRDSGCFARPRTLRAGQTNLPSSCRVSWAGSASLRRYGSW